jgi:hypothetical protein
MTSKKNTNREKPAKKRTGGTGLDRVMAWLNTRIPSGGGQFPTREGPVPKKKN